MIEQINRLLIAKGVTNATERNILTEIILEKLR